ncbi:hypothetical protein AKJ16_DCAP13669 [Drosera capensis]
MIESYLSNFESVEMKFIETFFHDLGVKAIPKINPMNVAPPYPRRPEHDNPLPDARSPSTTPSPLSPNCPSLPTPLSPSPSPSQSPSTSPSSAATPTQLTSSPPSSAATPFHIITLFDPTHHHHLAISSSLHVTVTISRPSLSSGLSSAVSAALDSSSPPSVRWWWFDCLGTVWVGKERYAWVDLGAGPVEYGPGLAGDGVVPRGEFHPMGTLHGRWAKSEKAVAADLAALVYGAYQVMAVPDLRIPVPFENTLVVRFFHVREKGMERDAAAYGLDWRSVEKSFRDEAENGELLLEGQRLGFEGVRDTSRFLFDNYTLVVSKYVDSKVLHRVLSDSSEVIKKLAGVKEEEDDFGRVLPVYVFNLDQSTLLLLDRYHQSVAFKDMVIAIRMRNTQTELL